MKMDLLTSLYVFMLAGFIGFEVIRRITPLLHTPLMSLTNALDAIAVFGAIVLAGEHKSTLSTVSTPSPAWTRSATPDSSSPRSGSGSSPSSAPSRCSSRSAGIYTVMALTVSRRTREIGVRVALGADRRRIVAAIFRRPLTQVGLGVVAGRGAHRAARARPARARSPRPRSRWSPATRRSCWACACSPAWCRRAARSASSRPWR